QAQHTAAMSTISDIDLPARYRRAPLSQEEIDHINGGGVNDPKTSSPKHQILFALKIPKKLVIQCHKKKNEITFKVEKKECN
ncbi:unnamed protein product, partial [Parnassius apollo]